MVGTPVLRMVVSRDSMKKATAISQGRRRRLESARVAGAGDECGASMGSGVPTLAGGVGGIGGRRRFGRRSWMRLERVLYHTQTDSLRSCLRRVEPFGAQDKQAPALTKARLTAARLTALRCNVE